MMFWMAYGSASSASGSRCTRGCNKASNRIWANGTEAAIRPNKPDRLRAEFVFLVWYWHPF